jgi:hypothetical protein
MEFRCNAAPNAAPCVRIATTDDQGRLLKKPKRIIKVVRNGESVFSWIDRCSRKHFTAMDDEAKRLNEKDYGEMFKELSDILKPYGKTVPKGTPFSVLADSLAKIEGDKNKKKEATKPELLTIPVDEPASSESAPEPKKQEETVELTNAQLKAKIEDLGGEYPPTANKAQLKDILSKLEADKEE